MRTALLKVAAVIVLTCSANVAHAQSSELCSGLRSAVGAVLGGALGTLIFPGVGTVWGAALGGGSACTIDYATRKRPPVA
jgi:hypothetical protein